MVSLSLAGRGLRRRRHTPVAGDGHPRQACRCRFTLAERLCRTADRINPARVHRSHHRLGRKTLTPGPAILRTVLQRNENTSILGQRFTSLAIGSADWMHHIRMRFLVDFITNMCGFRFSVHAPVGSGFIASLARPGGNVTGFVLSEPTMAGKWLELLKEIAPRVKRAALLFNPATAPFAEYFVEPFKAAALSSGVEAIKATVHAKSELETVIAAHAREPDSGLIVIPDAFLNVHRVDITSLAAHHRLPAIYPYRFYPKVGGLLSYGNDVVDNYRRAAGYADRIVKGAKPSELPVQSPAKFELVININTAKALGLDVPMFLRQRADEVIE